MKKIALVLSLLIALGSHAQTIVTSPTIDSTYTIPVNKGKTIKRVYALDLMKGTTVLQNGTTATTQAVGDHSQKVATDSFVLNAIGAATAGVSTFNGRSGAVSPTSGDYTVSQVTGAAPTASPTFTGTVTLPNGTSIANGNLTGFATISILKLTGRVARADASYTLTGSEFIVAFTSLTASRTVTLPPASGMPNTFLIIKDESGSASTTNKITIVGTVDNIVNPDAVTTSRGEYRIYSNGTSFFTW